VNPLVEPADRWESDCRDMTLRAALGRIVSCAAVKPGKAVSWNALKYLKKKTNNFHRITNMCFVQAMRYDKHGSNYCEIMDKKE
jgi:hypothetical protein